MNVSFRKPHHTVMTPMTPELLSITKEGDKLHRMMIK